MRNLLFLIGLIIGMLLVSSCGNKQEENQLSDTLIVSDNPQKTLVLPPSNTVTDVDGNVYKTVQIGDQLWMAENLKTTHYADGAPIPHLESVQDFSALYWEYPACSESNKSTYGLLYNWNAAMKGFPSSSKNPSGVQGICPKGWHLPSDAEWKQLTDYVSSQNQYVCGENTENIAKSLASKTFWNIENTGETPCAVGNNPSDNNTTGFNALPAGFIYPGKESYKIIEVYQPIGETAAFWTTTKNEKNILSAWIYELSPTQPVVIREAADYVTYFGLSVRCLKD